jgi:outer membrane protein OmpA-like peptidoglycan-associated protein
MSQVKDSTAEFIELNQEETVQLKNFMNLLVDMKIINQSPETVFPVSSTEEVVEFFLEDYIDVEFEVSQLVEEEVQTPLEMAAQIEEIQKKVDDPEDALSKLQQILVGQDLADIHNITYTIQQTLRKLEHQINDPDELIKLILPSFSELLRLKIAESKDEVAFAIAPIVDQAIRSRVEEDKTSVGEAIAEAVPIAITQQITVAPEEISEAIAPTMGRAIKKQIELEQNTVVDALYPIIGSTIAKYMAETVKAINKQIEESLSVKGVQRKIQAKLQGVSEAELILKEAIPFTIQAIFLIHKESGLIISEIQSSNAQQLESDMVAGMLTAIRSFANDCITQSGNSELDAIDYGTSKIILEVAGYCYLAIVTQGEPPQDFIFKMRQILAKVVKDYGESIKEFEGDLATIPSEIHILIETLINFNIQVETKKNKLSPILILITTILSAILIPWGIWRYHSGVIDSIENKTSLALASVPELAVYRLTVQEHQGKLQLTGKLPNQILRNKAEQTAKFAAPTWSIDNQIIAVEVPPDPVLAAAEVERITTVLNQIDDTEISAKYIDGKVAIEGTVSQIANVQKITQAFAQIPGVKSVSSAMRIQPLKIPTRFYFPLDSATLIPKDLADKVKQVKNFLNQHPNKHLKIIGYSYSINNNTITQQLALNRAKAVQKALINQGVKPSRLQVEAATNLPPGVDINQPEWVKRCVILEVI